MHKSANLIQDFVHFYKKSDRTFAPRGFGEGDRTFQETLINRPPSDRIYQQPSQSSTSS
ncbi:MAG: hypothetical protein HC903_00870 [Methylacidiphilales bacterium]|nr:hypothetical protein [Candidatus Methylacidiphilales bacterium]NJR16531.1 hypothetical protein [Calothrix sp. CSU_2_0]